jgi:hypothetical protein
MTIRSAAEKATNEVFSSLAAASSEDQAKQAIERAVIVVIPEEQERFVGVARQCCEANTDKARKITQEITRHKDVLIANLSGIR